MKRKTLLLLMTAAVGAVLAACDSGTPSAPAAQRRKVDPDAKVSAPGSDLGAPTGEPGGAAAPDSDSKKQP